jgi:ElaB/YqjD/DUF883 family membrane-anchored ribosome-binding protein
MENNPAPDATSDRLDAFTAELSATFDKTRDDLSGILDTLRTQAAAFDADQTRTQVKSWVEANPTIAVAIAVGGGLLLGRALGAAFSPPPPPTFKQRLASGAHEVGARASSLSEEILKGAAVAGAAIAAGSAKAAGEAAKGANRAGEVIADYASNASHVVSDLTEDASDAIHDLTDEAGKKLRKGTKKARKQGKHLAHEAAEAASIGSEMTDRALGAARTVVAAYVVKKIGEATGVLRS